MSDSDGRASEISSDTTSAPNPRAGRPTREQAAARHDALLSTALDHFLDLGFERATIEAIAASVNMTKRTVYARYKDKAALFLASVRGAIDRLEIGEERMLALDRGDLAETLAALARMRIERAMTPEGVKLQRIVNNESYRFPQVFAMSYEIGALASVRFLANIFARETAAGRLAIADPMLAANTFLAMSVTGATRSIVAGTPLTHDDIERRIAFGVRLFLDGARPR